MGEKNPVYSRSKHALRGAVSYGSGWAVSKALRTVSGLRLLKVSRKEKHSTVATDRAVMTKTNVLIIVSLESTVSSSQITSDAINAVYWAQIT